MNATKVSKTAAKLQSTNNYELFVQSEFNRDLRPGGVESLKKSMKENGYIPAYPIHCVRGEGAKLTIKAGHHRFEAAKSLGIAVYYVISDDLAAIHNLERVANAWSIKDYIKSHARAGSESHLAILEYSGRTGISLGQCASLLAGECACSGNVVDKVKNGTYELKPNKHAEDVALLVCGLRDIGVKFYANAQLVAALSTVSFLDEFDCKVFLHRAATNLNLLIKQKTTWRLCRMPLGR